MRIDKIAFSCSAPPFVSNDDYSSFWNIQARLWRSMGIEPVCLLYGDQAKTNMTEPTIIEMPVIEGLPWSVQLTWAKFCHPVTEPDKVWMIGDIDMLPLNRAYFTDAIAGYDEDCYLHLNAGGIACPRVGDPDGFIKFGPQRLTKDQGRNGGADLPAHYHVAKGHHFAIYAPLADKVRHIVMSNRYGLGPMEDKPVPTSGVSPYWHFWCADENYTSELLWNAMLDGLKYEGLHYNNSNDCQRIDRSHWRDVPQDYTYSEERARKRLFVDVHCVRPYERQREAAERIFDLCGVSV